MAAIDRRRELLIVQQVSGPLLADLDQLGRVLDANRGGFRTGSAGGSKAVDPEMPEDDRTDCEWDLTSAAAMGPDKARADAERLDACLERSRKALTEADDIRRAWLTGALVEAPPNPTGRWCGSCRREHSLQSVRVSNTRVKARLAEPIDLCDWCYRFVLHSSEAGQPGRLPTRGELRRHLEGDTVRVPDVRPKPQARARRSA